MTLLRFIISLLYSFAGVSGCVAFVLLKNYPAAVLAIGTGILNIILSHIHFQSYKSLLQEWYTPDQLRQISMFGFYSFGVSTSALIYFSITEGVLKKPILPIEDSTVIPLIWAFITLKSGLILFYYGRLYSRHQHSLLVEEPAPEEAAQPEEITP